MFWIVPVVAPIAMFLYGYLQVSPRTKAGMPRYAKAQPLPAWRDARPRSTSRRLTSRNGWNGIFDFRQP